MRPIGRLFTRLAHTCSEVGLFVIKTDEGTTFMSELGALLESYWLNGVLSLRHSYLRAKLV